MDGIRDRGVCACRQAADGSAVLVRVVVGQVPRDTSDEDGQVVKVDAETARRLLESGQAAPVRDDDGARG